MTALAFDHIVHFVDRDPSSAIPEWKKHGLLAVKGGSHLQWGSWNSLLYFGLSYVEYLAIENDLIVSGSNNPLIKQMNEDLQNGEGFGNICFRTSDIQSLRERLTNSGFTPSEIVNAERRREDGTILQWKMMFAKTSASMAPYPFFIQWDQEDADRLKAYCERGIIPEKQQHLHISKVYYFVQSPEDHAANWKEILQASEPSPIFDAIYNKEAISLKTRDVELIFAEGPTNRPAAIHVTGLGNKKSIELLNGLYLFS